MAERWADAVEQADTGARTQPGTELGTKPHAPAPTEQAHTEQADSISVEPTPTGYRHLGRMFRDELDRVQRLRRRVGPLLDPTDGAETTGGEGESS